MRVILGLCDTALVASVDLCRRTCRALAICTTICRSKFIGNYFGDDAIKDCGVCDNCLKKRSASITEEEFKKIKEHILNLIVDENILVQNILHVSKSIKKDKLWKVLDYLQSEKIIKIESNGRVYKLKPSLQ